MPSHVLDISRLSKLYGKTIGIEDVSFTLDEGEIFGFIGPNGAGKSTTIRILLNLIFPSGGTAKIMGMDVIKDSKKIKKITGYIPSDANAYPYMTVNEFLNYCMRFYGQKNGNGRRNELAEIFDLDLKKKISDLSFGNRRKVSIVQSLQHNPLFLIMDEPTTGLDPLIQSRFFDLIREENKKGMTLFFSSHILSEIQLLCKRVAIIKDGKIANLEDIESLRRKQLKKIKIWPGEINHSVFLTIPGIEGDVTRAGDMLSFMYSGDINDLVRLLSVKKIANLTIEEPSLEEIFMHYYN
jgi:ABC-2 type transport system ATP-binding protein